MKWNRNQISMPILNGLNYCSVIWYDFWIIAGMLI